MISILVTSVNFCSHALASVIAEGKFSGQSRTMFIAENNIDDLQDWHGLATGGKLKFVSGAINGFTFGIAGYISYDVDSNKAVIDPLTGKASRYVLGMYDVESPASDSVALLGESYINWQDDTTHLTLGRMKINTPLMNAFDGRMIPTLFEGAWLQQKLTQHVDIQLGYINNMAIRGTADFKSMESAVGVLSNGKNVDGSKGNYQENLTSAGVLVGSFAYQVSPSTKISAWDYYFDNVINNALFQADHDLAVNNVNYAISGLYLRQDIVGSGGNSDESLSYVANNFKANIYSTKFQVNSHGAMVMIAGTYITADGRYSKPREWGKDPLFTFQKRELTDGFGDSSAWLIRAAYQFDTLGIKGLKIIADYSQHSRAMTGDTVDVTFNKYAFPSYSQFNIDVFYQTDSFIKNSQIEFLYVNKNDTKNTNNYTYDQGKADVELFNIVFNINF